MSSSRFPARVPRELANERRPITAGSHREFLSPKVGVRPTSGGPSAESRVEYAEAHGVDQSRYLTCFSCGIGRLIAIAVRLEYRVLSIRRGTVVASAEETSGRRGVDGRNLVVDDASGIRLCDVGDGGRSGVGSCADDDRRALDGSVLSQHLRLH